MKNRSIYLRVNSHSGSKTKQNKKEKGKKNDAPLVKETLDPDRGQNKEISTFLFIIIIIVIIKHTAFYIQMHLTSFLKEKKLFVSLIWLAKSVCDWCDWLVVLDWRGFSCRVSMKLWETPFQRRWRAGGHYSWPGCGALTGKTQKNTMKPMKSNFRSRENRTASFAFHRTCVVSDRSILTPSDVDGWITHQYLPAYSDVYTYISFCTIYIYIRFIFRLSFEAAARVWFNRSSAQRKSSLLRFRIRLKKWIGAWQTQAASFLFAGRAWLVPTTIWLYN